MYKMMKCCSNLVGAIYTYKYTVCKMVFGLLTQRKYIFLSTLFFQSIFLFLFFLLVKSSCRGQPTFSLSLTFASRPSPLCPSVCVSVCVPVQDQRVATCSSTTSLRSLGMESWCRCSCLSVMSSPPKCLWIGRQTKVNALVGKNDQTKRLLVIYSDYSFLS